MGNQTTSFLFKCMGDSPGCTAGIVYERLHTRSSPGPGGHFLNDSKIDKCNFQKTNKFYLMGN